MSNTSSQIAVVTGAGSGVGRSVAILLAERGWSVALVGRTQSTLDETASLAGADGRAISIVCDVGDESAVRAMSERVRREIGDPSVLVCAAGLNVPRRAFDVVTGEDFRKLIDVNLNGAFYCAQAFLHAMRAAKRGTIVNVSSDAGLKGNSGSGPAYVASKFGMVGLTEALNAEERSNGIRACVVCPGEIDTVFLDLRSVKPTAEARAKMLKVEDVAACVMLAIELPERAVVEQIVVRPTAAK